MGRNHWVIVIVQESQCGGMRYQLWLAYGNSFGFLVGMVTVSFNVLGHDVFLFLKFANRGCLTEHFLADLFVLQ